VGQLSGCPLQAELSTDPVAQANDRFATPELSSAVISEGIRQGCPKNLNANATAKPPSRNNVAHATFSSVPYFFASLLLCFFASLLLCFSLPSVSSVPLWPIFFLCFSYRDITVL
jgi:hypothetical protein